MTDMSERISSVRGVSMNQYLQSMGIVPTKETLSQNTYSSPFANDSDPSFVIYNKTNDYFCFATGKGGDIIHFIRELKGLTFWETIKHLEEGNIQKFKKQIRPTRKVRANFRLLDHISTNRDIVKTVTEYAESRGIKDGYVVTTASFRGENEWISKPAMGFVHVDENLKPCGIKKRVVDGVGDERFKAKGRQRFYILQNTIKDSFDDPVLYIVESESSANSLWQHAKENKINCVVISFGSVSSVPKELPKKYRDIADIRIIIDYDGSEELFSERKKLYRYHDGEFIKIRLKKGQDLNSMYIDGSISLLKLW